MQEATAGGLLGCRDHTTKLTCVIARWFAFRETELLRRVRRRELPRVPLPAWVLALDKPGEPREYQRQVPFLEFLEEGGLGQGLEAFQIYCTISYKDCKLEKQRRPGRPWPPFLLLGMLVSQTELELFFFVLFFSFFLLFYAIKKGQGEGATTFHHRTVRRPGACPRP